MVEKKTWLLAGGVLLVGALCLFVVVRSTGDAGVVAAPADPVALDGVPLPPSLPAAQAAIPPAVLLQGPPPPPQIYDPAPLPPRPGSWESIPAVARAAGLGAAGGAVGRGLSELGDLLAACFDEDVQARHGMTPPTRTQEADAAADGLTTVLALQIETTKGGARIVDAPVDVRGTASDGLVSCTQKVLRGRTFEAPGVRGGERHRLLYPLVP